MGRWSAAAVVALALLVPDPTLAARLRSGSENLLQVVLPVPREVARAHPHVNVVVTFGTTDDGQPADPSTLKARFGGQDVTRSFTAILTGGTQTGAYAVLPPERLRLGARPRNRLRLLVQAQKPARGRGARDVDRVRFGAADVPNEPPVALASADADVAVAGRAIGFAASGSRDPDGDQLTYGWNFGDGATAAESTPTHTFGPTDAPEVVVTLSVSDGQASTTATLVLPTTPATDPGRTPGQLRIEADQPLEFGAVAVGSTAVRTLRVRNVDPTSTSQVKVRPTAAGSGAFTVAPSAIDLGPDAVDTITVTFRPVDLGHDDARIGIVASAANRASVTYLAHGFGGTAPGSGPTLAATPVFATNLVGADVAAWLPDGTMTPMDATVRRCTVTGDACLRDEDCKGPGEGCGTATQGFSHADLCSDGTSLFLLGEDTFTDPNPDAEPGDSGTLLRLDLDAGATVVGKEILGRTTEDTAHLTCDGYAKTQGGLVYLAELHAVAATATCPRDEREALLRVNKATGNRQVVDGFSRLDASADVDACDLLDAVQQLRVTPDGRRLFAGFESRGLWRIRPTALPFTADVSDRFALDTDGNALVAVAHDRGATTTIELFRITDQQVELGAVSLAAIAPCASLTVPTNQTHAPVVRTIVASPASTSSLDRVALVSFVGTTRDLPTEVFPFGPVQGIVAFAVPASTTTCAPLGLVSIQGFDLAN